jgi:hypothetical protein
MKNTVKVLGIIAIVVVIGFGVTACEDPPPEYDIDSSTDGRLTITNLNNIKGKSLSAHGSFGGSSKYLRCTSKNNPYSSSELFIYNDSVSVTFYVWIMDGSDGSTKNYTGNDQNVNFSFWILTKTSTERKDITVNFANGVGSVAIPATW